MTQEELDVIKARANAATDGPWTYDQSDMIRANYYQYHIADIRGYGGNLPMEANGEFIASARTDIPLLLAEIERIKEIRDKWYVQYDKERTLLNTQRDNLLIECGRLKTELANRTSRLCLNEKDEYGDG